MEYVPTQREIYNSYRFVLKFVFMSLDKSSGGCAYV